MRTNDTVPNSNDPRGVAGRGWTLRRCVAPLVVVTMMVASVDARAESSAEQEVAVTPYRPTVSTPAALSAPGWIEVEAGLQGVDLGASARRDSVPYAIKLALSEDWGVRIGGEAWVRETTASGDQGASGGDTAVILKRRFAVNGRSAFGVEFGVTAPTARVGLHSGSGTTDYSATGIFSADLGQTAHADINVGLTRLGSVDPALGRRQTLWAVALQESVNARWGLVGEFSGTRQMGVPRTAQLLGGATYSPGKRVVWDFGVAREIAAARPSWTVFVGTTFLVSRVF